MLLYSPLEGFEFTSELIHLGLRLGIQAATARQSLQDAAAAGLEVALASLQRLEQCAERVACAGAALQRRVRRGRDRLDFLAVVLEHFGKIFSQPAPSMSAHEKRSEHSGGAGRTK